MIRLLRRFLPRLLPLIIGVSVFQAAQAALNIMVPLFSAKLIDEGVLHGDSDAAWRAGLPMLAAAIGQLICTVVAVVLGVAAAAALARDVRRDMVHHIAGLSQQEVARLGPASLATRVTNDVQQVQVAFLLLCNTAVMVPFAAAFGTAMALRHDASLSWVLVGAMAILIVVVGGLMTMATPASRAAQGYLEKTHRVLREQIVGHRVVRAFNREDGERRRFADANADLTAASLTSGRYLAVLFPVLALVQNLAAVLVVWFGAAGIRSQQLTVGGMVAVLGYLVLVLAAVMMAITVVVALPRAAVSAGRICAVLDMQPSVALPARPIRPSSRDGKVELRAVSFKHSGAHLPVLHEVCLTAHAGERVAIVGSTGSGKSTLLALIPRLIDVTSGTVLVEDTDVRAFDLRDLRGRLALVPQRPHLFAGTIASNLRFGKPDVTESGMWQALEIADARDFVEQLPGGLDAPVHQAGANFSGGQRQRLSIARAVVRRPDVYLFDDCFSALDLATDARVRTALRSVTAEATVIVVAQRIATVVDADRILVLDEGRCVGVGSHQELLSSCTTYAEIVASQLSIDEVPV